MDTRYTLNKRIAELEASELSLERGVSAMDHALSEARQQRDRLRAALEHAAHNLCHNLDCDCSPDRMRYQTALNPQDVNAHANPPATAPERATAHERAGKGESTT